MRERAGRESSPLFFVPDAVWQEETAQSNSTLFTVGVTPSNLMVTRKLTKSL